MPHTDIGTCPCLSTLLLFLGGGCGSFHAEHGLEARGTPVNPLTAFVVLQQGESNTHSTYGKSFQRYNTGLGDGSVLLR